MEEVLDRDGDAAQRSARRIARRGPLLLVEEDGERVQRQLRAGRGIERRGDEFRRRDVALRHGRGLLREGAHDDTVLPAPDSTGSPAGVPPAEMQDAVAISQPRP